MTDIFNEQSLRAEVVKVWGEHGAHILVFDELLRRAAVLDDEPRSTEGDSSA